MTFGDSIATCLHKYATFSGRATRPEYWWFFLFNVIVSVGAAILDAAVGGGQSSVRVGPTSNGVFGLIASLLLLVPNLAVGARRLHDIGRTGWWQLIWVVPCVGLVVMLVFLCTRSDPYDNRFGPVVRP